jgi:mono/diheme cytochrome c family protein
MAINSFNNTKNSLNKYAPKSKQPALKRNKWLWFGIPATVLITAAAATSGIMWLNRPSLKDAPQKTDTKQVAAYLASDKFNQLSMQDKQKYVSQISDGKPPWQVMRSGDNLSKEERDKLRENLQPVMQQVMKERLNNFFKMSPEDREKELDKIMGQMRQGGGMRGAFGGGGRGGGGGNNNAAVANNNNQTQRPAAQTNNRAIRRKERFETVDSNTRAQGVEFGKIMMARFQQRATQPAAQPAAQPAR